MGRGEAAIASHRSFTFEFRPYQRRFQVPLVTHHGAWRDRQGILLKLTPPTGQSIYGEIAPLPWFGSETLEAALAWCQRLPSSLTQPALCAIPDTLPACQFGFESAFFSGRCLPSCPLPQSALLPAGERALSSWQPLWAAGFRTFKWKIGVTALAQELTWFRQLQAALPQAARLRLDANGGLSVSQAAKWLEACDRQPVEYLEQPLPPSQLPEMLALQAHHVTAIALDESVATLRQLQTCLDQGWQSIIVIKPAIAGSPAQLRRLWETYAIDAVFSSVFETAIGQAAGLYLATALGNRDRAHGYGISHWFEDGLNSPNRSFDELWQRL